MLASTSNFSHYEKDGRAYERITQVLSRFEDPSLANWKARVGLKEASRIKKKAMGIGTNVDNAIRAYIDGRKQIKLKSKEAENCFDAFRHWLADYGYHGLVCGTPLFDDVLMVAGTPDILRSSEVIDIKCSSVISDNYWLQTEFYGRMKGGEPHNYWKSILRLDKNLGIYEYKRVPLSDADWDAVRSAITLYRWYQKPVIDGKEEDLDANSITHHKE